MDVTKQPTQPSIAQQTTIQSGHRPEQAKIEATHQQPAQAPAVNVREDIPVAQPKQPVGKAVARIRNLDDEVDADLPFAMPDMSNIDQDIAAAIQQAMIGSKKG